MGNANYFADGDWNAACAECGRKFKASELVQLPPGVAGSGLYVCRAHWNPRQPQDFVRGIQENMAAPWVQPVLTTSSMGVLTAGGIVDTPTTFVGIPFVPGGQTLGNVVLSDYIPAGSEGDVNFTIPEGTTITGTITPGTIPSGSTIIVHNGGTVTKNPQPNFPSKGTPPLYYLKWNGGQYPPPVLVFDVQPSNAGVSAVITPPVQVWVIGNLSIAITDVVFNIMLTIGINPGSPPGVLSGTLTQPTVNGVATFSDLQIDQAGNGYILIASVV